MYSIFYIHFILKKKCLTNEDMNKLKVVTTPPKTWTPIYGQPYKQTAQVDFITMFCVFCFLPLCGFCASWSPHHFFCVWKYFSFSSHQTSTYPLKANTLSLSLSITKGLKAYKAFQCYNYTQHSASLYEYIYIYMYI